MSSILTGKQLAEYCAAQAGQAYVWGGLGYTLTESRIEQLKKLYPSVFTDAYIAKCRARLGMRAFDCVGLVKHFLWGNTGDGVLRRYAVNGIPDTTANGLFALCGERGSVSALPEKPGLLLHRDGHVGVYLGGGRVAEARGIDYGVVISSVSGRDFTQWGELPGVDYSKAAAGGRTIGLEELRGILKNAGVSAVSVD
jgi:cell wall-associated NlpC family hydrolase